MYRLRNLDEDLDFFFYSSGILGYSRHTCKNTQNEKNKTLKIMVAYEKNTGADRINRKHWKYAPSFYISAENIYHNTPEINSYDYSKETIVLEVEQEIFIILIN